MWTACIFSEEKLKYLTVSIKIIRPVTLNSWTTACVDFQEKWPFVLLIIFISRDVPWTWKFLQWPKRWRTSCELGPIRQASLNKTYDKMMYDIKMSLSECQIGSSWPTSFCFFVTVPWTLELHCCRCQPFSTFAVKWVTRRHTRPGMCVMKNMECWMNSLNVFSGIESL